MVYEFLLFAKDQEIPRSSVSNIEGKENESGNESRISEVESNDVRDDVREIIIKMQIIYIRLHITKHFRISDMLIK